MKDFRTYKGFFLVIIPLFTIKQLAIGQIKKPEELINAVGYSVPTSPAFELLPNKPSEVTNMVTPRDILATIPTFVNKGKVKTGIAADIRPFSYFVGSLDNYQKRTGLRALWRTVISIGTAPDPNQNNDSFLSAGIRTTLIDLGDPRANRSYTDSLAKVYHKALVRQGPPPLDMTTAQQKARHEIASAAADSLRIAFNADSWNRFRVDAGYAYMARAVNSSYRSDSLRGDRWGIWLSFGGRIGRKGTWFRDKIQLNGTLKGSRVIHLPTEEDEKKRYVTGARIRFFVNQKMALSLEGAQIWSKYKTKNLNESWSHFAAIAEINIPAVGGWLTFAYGGDTAHRTAADSKFSFSYAVATNRIIKK